MVCGVKAGNNRPARDDDDKQGGFHRTPVTLLENLRVDLKKEDGRYEIEPGDIAVPSAARVRLGVQLGGTSVKEGVGPIVLFFDGEHIWTGNAHSDTVTKFSRDGEALGNFDVGDVPIAFTEEGDHIWVANWREHTVSKLSKDGEDLGRFDTGRLPYGIEFDGEHIWTANSMDGTVSKLSLDGEVVATYPVGAAPAKNTFSKW